MAIQPEVIVDLPQSKISGLSTALAAKLDATAPAVSANAIKSVALPSAPPTAGQVLAASSPTQAVWVSPEAGILKTTGTGVTISSAAPPTAGQVLKASSATQAGWADPVAVASTLAYTTTSDTAITRGTTPASGQILVTTGTGTTAAWVASPYATTSWVTNQLSSYVLTTTLSGYVSTASLTTTLGGYVSTAGLSTALSPYALKTMAQPYEILGGCVGTPAASQLVLGMVMSRAVTLRTTGHQCKALTGPTASFVLPVMKNGSTQIGTITVAGTTGTVSIGTAISFAAGDTVSIKTPAAVNGVADLMITLLADLA